MMGYIRKIESMGEGLLLIEIRKEQDFVGLRYHLLYNNDYKPPLDLALDPEDGSLEYLNYILQDDKIIRRVVKPAIRECRWRMKRKIPPRVDERNYLCDKMADFDTYLYENDIWILRKETVMDELLGFTLDELTKILFQNGRFCGCLIKNISQEEMRQIELSCCI